MAFKDYTAFVEPLALPFNGTVYEVAPVGIQDGITLTQALDPETDDVLTDEEFARLLLGDTLDRMRADNVPPGFIIRCAMTALADFQAGRLVAEGVWETGADPKALTRWVGARMETSETTLTAEATTTPRPRSGSSTTTRARKTTK